LKPGPRLTEEGQRYVLQSLAEFKPNIVILKGLQEKWGIELTTAAITHYRNRYRDDIDRHRVEYLRDLASIELTHRKQRLLKLSEWLTHCEKGIPVYIRGPKGLKIEMRPDYGLGLRILDAIREEMKEARFEAGEGADGEEVLEWQVRIRKRFEQMQREAKEVDRKRASPPTRGHEVGEGEVVEEDEGSTDPSSLSLPLRGEREGRGESEGGGVDQRTLEPTEPTPQDGSEGVSEPRGETIEGEGVQSVEDTEPTGGGTPTPPHEAEER